MVGTTQLRVVIVAGGVAGLEVLMRLLALAADRVALTFVAAEDVFVYRLVGVEAPFSAGPTRPCRRIRRLRLTDKPCR
jgi:NADH dehydrogenase FAD-containing subunit